jgi:outer membrane translocation and assembly module TamA
MRLEARGIRRVTRHRCDLAQSRVRRALVPNTDRAAAAAHNGWLSSCTGVARRPPDHMEADSACHAATHPKPSFQTRMRSRLVLRPYRSFHRFRVCLWLFGAWSLAGAVSCASVPKGQYGVDSIEWIGMKKVAPEALESCLVTRSREYVDIRLGIGSAKCGVPPFDSSPPTIDLWRLPWTEWPVFDPAIFEVERERIERFYHARGYYDAHVLGVQTFVHGKPVDANECRGSGSDCKLKVVVSLSEGAPTHVSAVSLVATPQLPAAKQKALIKDLKLRVGQVFDESSYEADKAALKVAMSEASYARAKVSGQVLVDRVQRTARVEYRIDTGPACVFGKVSVEGAPDVPQDLILQAANIPTGKPYEQSTVDDAERAIFALHVFSAVKLEQRGDGKVVDLVAVLQRGRVSSWNGGVGVLSGTLVRNTSDEAPSIPQWDVHLTGSYENKNFLGGLRRLRLEERPRLIFLNSFPAVPHDGIRLGNLVSAIFEQPSTFEARTKLVGKAAWDLGPDPFLGFFRHDISVKVGLERPLWHQRLLASVAIEHDLYEVRESQAPPSISSYRLPFIEQGIVLDLRNDPRRPRRGIYAAVLVQEASKLGGYGSWDYVRVLPDLRGYVPLFWDIVLAARFAVGALVILNHANGLDPESAELGPQVYRLRGGGANSNRGFLAGRLGDGLDGSTRRWEASLELRIPLGSDFGFVVFGDAGDVHTSFRFSHANAATGFGIRYYSVLGALRLDAGWRIPGWQVLGNSSEEPVRLRVVPSALHLTIGEAF